MTGTTSSPLLEGSDGSALRWYKSSFSGTNGCVEVAHTAEGVAVRDTKDPNGPVLRFTVKEWRSFLAGAANDEFIV